jgi:hypothetical protein
MTTRKKMTVDIHECKEQPEWDALVARSLNPTVFHKWDWLKIMEKHSGCQLHTLTAKMGTNYIGLLPIFSRMKKGLRYVFSPPPLFSPKQLGPLMIPYDRVLKQQTIEKTIISFSDSFDDYIRHELKPNYVGISTTVDYNDARPMTWNGYTATPRYSYIVDLSIGEDAVFDRFQPSLKVEIRRSMKAGIVIKEGSMKELEPVLNAYMHQGEAFVAYVRDLFMAFNKSHLRFLSAEYGGEQIGGLVCVCHHSRSSSLLCADIKQVEGISPREVMQWEAMRVALKNGVKSYEVGDASDQNPITPLFNPRLATWFKSEKYSPKVLKYVSKYESGR